MPCLQIEILGEHIHFENLNSYEGGCPDNCLGRQPKFVGSRVGDDSDRSYDTH